MVPSGGGCGQLKLFRTLLIRIGRIAAAQQAQQVAPLALGSVSRPLEASRLAPQESNLHSASSNKWPKWPQFAATKFGGINHPPTSGRAWSSCNNYHSPGCIRAPRVKEQAHDESPAGAGQCVSCAPNRWPAEWMDGSI